MNGPQNSHPNKAWRYFGTKIHSYINQELFINIVLRSSPYCLISIFVNVVLLFLVGLFLSLTEVIINDCGADGVREDSTKIIKKLKPTGKSQSHTPFLHWRWVCLTF